MPLPALDVDREQVRMLCVQYGPREAARMCGIKEATVLDWCASGKWLADIRLAKAKPVNQSSPIKPPAQALTDTIVADGIATKTAAMIFAKLTSQHAAKLAETSPDEALAQAMNVKAVLGTAQIAGSWASAVGDGGTVVNIALIGMKLDQS